MKYPNSLLLSPQLPSSSCWLWSPPTDQMKDQIFSWSQASTEPIFPMNISHPVASFQAASNQHLPMNSSINETTERHREEEEKDNIGAMKEMMFKIAVMQPVDIDPAMIQKPRRRNVRISNDPQTVAARLRRERISERIRILRRLVPGGSKMDTASMLDEAILYVKFLKKLVGELQSNNNHTQQAGKGTAYVGSHHWSMGHLTNHLMSFATTASSAFSTASLASTSLAFSTTSSTGDCLLDLGSI